MAFLFVASLAAVLASAMAQTTYLAQNQQYCNFCDQNSRSTNLLANQLPAVSLGPSYSFCNPGTTNVNGITVPANSCRLVPATPGQATLPQETIPCQICSTLVGASSVITGAAPYSNCCQCPAAAGKAVCQCASGLAYSISCKRCVNPSAYTPCTNTNVIGK